MNEFKTLASEKWVHIEVGPHSPESFLPPPGQKGGILSRNPIRLQQRDGSR